MRPPGSATKDNKSDIPSYQEIIRWLGDSDPTTRQLMESILAEEEEHSDDLNDLLGN